MIKIFAFITLVFSAYFTSSQKAFEATDEFTILGLVDKPLVCTYADLTKEKIVDLGDYKVTNHLGEFKKEYKNVKGVLLMDVLKKINITVESPKLLSEYYMVFKASDGYAAVVSWNEFFNTEIGNSFYVVLEADNKSQINSSEKILLISTKDFKTGRRHIKGLQTIEVKRI